MLSRGLLTIVCALSLGLAACGDDDSTGPGDPSVIIAVDSFQFRATNMDDTTVTFSYAWPNAGTQATVEQTSSITAGSATITVFDADSAQVYTRSLTENGDFVSAAGVSGSWTVHIVLTGMSGNTLVRLQRKI